MANFQKHLPIVLSHLTFSISEDSINKFVVKNTTSGHYKNGETGTFKKNTDPKGWTIVGSNTINVAQTQEILSILDKRLKNR